MVKLTEKELKIIHEKCGSNFAQRYRGIIKRTNDKVVKIVNTGMVSSGKSSLFNILIDSTEEEHFPTGAARTTTVADYFDYKNISFIDTPGIDVRNEDDDLAFRTIMEADLILMVHNIRTGPINRSEAEWLENIVKRMNGIEMCQARLIFVCTWKDTREKDADYFDIIADVKQQVFDIVGAEIPFFEVSVKKYMTGVEKQKDILKTLSGVLELKQYLEDYAVKYIETKEKMNQEELEVLLLEIASILNEKKKLSDNQINQIRKNVLEKYKSRRSTWNQIYELFSFKRQQLSDLEKEYNSI